MRDNTMDEEEIMLARKFAPEAIRVMVEIARRDDDASAKQKAITTLIDRGFLGSSNPTDDDLEQIERMSDAEILGIVLGRGLH